LSQLFSAVLGFSKFIYKFYYDSRHAHLLCFPTILTIFARCAFLLAALARGGVIFRLQAVSHLNKFKILKINLSVYMNMITKSPPLLLLILFSSFISSYCGVGQHHIFRFMLKPGRSQCFGQDVAEETLFSLIVSPENETYTNIDYEMIDPEENQLRQDEGVNKFNIVKVSNVSGIYKICILNREQVEIKFFFHMVLDAGMDLLETVLQDAEIPALAEIINLSMKADHVKKMAQAISFLEGENFDLSDLVIKSLPYFSALFLVILALVMCTQTYYLRKFFMEKKLV
jgi:emp24/gp25L/p24 family/GOLD